MKSSKTVSIHTPPGFCPEPGIVQSRTLFDIEESLLLMGEAIADAEELTPELEADFHRYLETAKAKRDQVARFREECEWQAECAKKESARLAKRKKRFERKVERVDFMLLSLFAAMNVPRLEGDYYTLAKVKNPPSVDVLDLEAIADEYKRVSVTLPAEDWKLLVESLPEELRSALISRLFKHEVAPELDEIKPVLARNEAVTGARLKTHEYRVEVR